MESVPHMFTFGVSCKYDGFVNVCIENLEARDFSSLVVEAYNENG